MADEKDNYRLGEQLDPSMRETIQQIRESTAQHLAPQVPMENALETAREKVSGGQHIEHDQVMPPTETPKTPEGYTVMWQPTPYGIEVDSNLQQKNDDFGQSQYDSLNQDLDTQSHENETNTDHTREVENQEQKTEQQEEKEKGEDYER